MWESIIGAVLEWIPSLVSKIFQKKEKSEYCKKYEAARFEVSKALTMYVCCYRNPVDLAETTNHESPPMYRTGSEKLRSLASTLRAISETIPDDVNDVGVSKEDLYKASEYLIGLSNHFTTPYNCGMSNRHLKTVTEFESNVRKLLQLPTRK